MIRSMTAFARQEFEGGTGALTWELRSVNHRYLEIAVRLPEELRALEPVIRERASKRLKRGKLDCNLRYRPAPNLASGLHLDPDYLESLLTTVRTVEQRLDHPAPLSAIEALRWPGVLREEQANCQSLTEQATNLFEAGLNELIATREREGAGIRKLIGARLDQMPPLVDTVRQRLPEVRQRIREKLLTRLAELTDNMNSDRLEQELVFLAQKTDVDEELDRLTTHIEEVRRVLDRDEPVGRRLDFLMQEFNREANTLASKSADTETTRVSVELKVLIEQMREQVQNIE